MGSLLTKMSLDTNLGRRKYNDDPKPVELSECTLKNLRETGWCMAKYLFLYTFVYGLPWMEGHF